MNEQEVTARFAAQMLGAELVDEPAPGSPLAELQELERQRPVTPADVARLRDRD